VPYQKVFQTTKKVIEEQGFVITEIDKQKGIIKTKWRIRPELEGPMRVMVEAKIEKNPDGTCSVCVKCPKERQSAVWSWIPSGRDTDREQIIIDRVRVLSLYR
jgi:uncharacterized lipoprotein